MPGGANEPFRSWDEVAAFALTLPETVLGSSYGRPAVKLRGKAFVYPGREPGSFCLAAPIDEKELLMETEPETFWESAHYRGWPAVLVRYDSPSRERIETVIRRGWWDRATKAQRTSFGPRP